jgi:hypothetical protein
MLQLTRIKFQTLHRNIAELDVCDPQCGEILNFLEQIAKTLLRSPFGRSLQPLEVRRAVLAFLEYRRLPRKPFCGRYRSTDTLIDLAFRIAGRANAKIPQCARRRYEQRLIKEPLPGSRDEAIDGSDGFTGLAKRREKHALLSLRMNFDIEPLHDPALMVPARIAAAIHGAQ